MKSSSQSALHQQESRSGMTIVEVLVCLGIISLLMALVMPAVQSGRELSRRAACLNNLKQLGLATTEFESAHGVFPGFSNARLPTSPLRPNESIHQKLLPFLDQLALSRLLDAEDRSSPTAEPPSVSPANLRGLQIKLAVFSCPTDNVPAGATSYRASTGTSPGLFSQFQGQAPGGALQGFVMGGGLSAARVRDGMSQTVFFTEKLIGDGNTATFHAPTDVVIGGCEPRCSTADEAEAACRSVTAVRDHASYGGRTWLLSSHSYTFYNHILTPNSPIPDCSTPVSLVVQGAYTARSLHPGGVNVVCGDGSCRFVASGIDRNVWRAIGTIDASETIAWPE